VETHDGGKNVFRLLAVGALVVTLVGVFAGMGDKYIAVPSDSRTAPLRIPPERQYNFPHVAPPLSPLIRFGTSTWTYEGSQGQVYTRQYAKSTFARECPGEYCQYQHQGEPLFRTVGSDSTF